MKVIDGCRVAGQAGSAAPKVISFSIATAYDDRVEVLDGIG
jgi:hypothetical protein